jgi:ParB-like chromosome segregation protein Spo0J
MKRLKLEEMSDGQLADRFTAIAIEQDRALLYSEIAKYNRLIDQMIAVQEELKSRSGDHRKVLVLLYEHPNWQVRLMAAHATLAIEPEAGRRLLESIATSRHYPQAGDAGMSLDSLDRGIYKPK